MLVAHGTECEDSGEESERTGPPAPCNLSGGPGGRPDQPIVHLHISPEGLKMGGFAIEIRGRLNALPPA